MATETNERTQPADTAKAIVVTDLGTSGVQNTTGRTASGGHFVTTSKTSGTITIRYAPRQASVTVIDNGASTSM